MAHNQPDQRWKKRKSSQEPRWEQAQDGAIARAKRTEGRRFEEKPGRQRPLWQWAAAAVFLFLLVFGGVRLLQKGQDTTRTEQINEDNRQLVGQDGAGDDAGADQNPEEEAAPYVTLAPGVIRVKPSASPRPAMLGKFDELYEKNSDLAGWLKVEAAYRIDFAVVQNDNSFYMTHDFTRAENREGTAFVDETNSLWPRDDNLIIYAHNMKSGSMFGRLNELMKPDAVKKSPFTVFDTLYETGVYIPFAAFICDVTDPDAPDYFNFYTRNFKTQDAFDRFVKRARELSDGSFEAVDVRIDDALLTLSTCHDDASKKRLIVMLRRLRPGETREAAQQKYFAAEE